MYSVLADKKPLSGSRRQDKDILSPTITGYSADGDDGARGEVVVIPVDASKEAECAFDCKYYTLCENVMMTIIMLLRMIMTDEDLVLIKCHWQ